MNSLYFDNAATTRVSESAANEALRVMRTLYANPSSAHAFGFEAEKCLKTARETLVRALGYEKGDGTLIFTSCGTEADNMAVFGAAKANGRRAGRIVVSDSEHPAVENAVRELEKDGYIVARIPTVGGALDMDFAANAITPDTALVSCMTVNNETGALYDVASLCRLARRKAPNAYVHTDAVQAFTKVKSLAAFDADLVSISGHKIHAPKGIGALFVKKGVKVPPLLYGGGQEGGRRSGTEALPNIAAFALAAREAMTRFDERMTHFRSLNGYLCTKIAERRDMRVNSVQGAFAPHILSIAVPGVRSEVLLRFLSGKGIYVSAGSACSAKHADNRVLRAFGLDDRTADGTLRVSFSTENTKEDVDVLFAALCEGADTLARTR